MVNILPSERIWGVMVAKVAISNLVTRRNYSELEKHADEYIRTSGWNQLLKTIKSSGSPGKSRDALVSLLQLEAVGGTDSDIFKEFASLEGDTLNQIRAGALEHSMDILTEQIENRHTYFLDVDAMSTTPYAVLVKDVIDARKREIEQLSRNPSRIEVLGTYYGFTILMIDGSKPVDSTTRNRSYYYWRRGTYLDEDLTDSAVNAMRSLTKELGDEVDPQKTYRTLGSSRIFKSRCTKRTAEILANAVRIALYKAPGNRATAARTLGRTEDLRTLPFLHHRLPLEQNRTVRIALINALGKVGHWSSIDILKEVSSGGYWSKTQEAAVASIGKIYSPECRNALIQLVRSGRTSAKAAAIQALSNQNSQGLVEILTPYLTSKSRPVLRSSVLALAKLGKPGKAAIKRQAPLIIKRIGYDRPSKSAVVTMLEISGVGKMKPVHEYFAKRIKKMHRTLRRWTQNRNTSYSYYWRRWEQRARKKLVDFIRLATYLRPPFDEEFLRVVSDAKDADDDKHGITHALGRSPLAQALEEYELEIVYKQTFLSSYR
ncbi:MAG: HEAT repeat domain-containing protein [Promethearchaeota archaeon]